uniref:Uncharacterized protein n=1 Tax=Hucho hucho TaxID=62062 RepID=A0A4W5QUU0_9TELE
MSSCSARRVGNGIVGACCYVLSPGVIIDGAGDRREESVHVAQIAMCVLGLTVLFSVFCLGFDLITRTKNQERNGRPSEGLCVCV